MDKHPEVIEGQFTEEDRQASTCYYDGKTCLLAIALKRLGFPQVEVGAFGDTAIKNADRTEYEAFYETDSNLPFSFETAEAIEKKHKMPTNPGDGPFYAEAVVGKPFRLIKKESVSNRF